MLNIFLIFFFLQIYCIEPTKTQADVLAEFSLQHNGIMGEGAQHSLEERADSLHFVFQKIKNAESIDDIKKYEELFFLLFPDTHQMLESFYGLNYKTGKVGLLFDHGCDHIDRFFDLTSINNDTLITKIINISIDAIWDHGSMTFQHGVQSKFNENMKKFCNLLSGYSNQEIFNFWYFFYDGPHPENYKADYKELHPQIKKIDQNIAGLMEKAFEQLLSEDRCPGH